MSLEDTASDGFSENVTRLERGLDEFHRHAPSLADLPAGVSSWLLAAVVGEGLGNVARNVVTNRTYHCVSLTTLNEPSRSGWRSSY